MKTPLLLLITLLLVALPAGLKAQTEPTDTAKSDQLYVVTKNDGTEYIGKILSDDGREVLLLTENLGKIYIPKADIKSIVKVEDKKQIVNGEFLGTGPFTTRYSFTTNALPIKKGENYAMVNLYGPEVHFAVTDHFSLGVMTTWIGSPFVLAAKYSIPTANEKVNFSFGSLNGTTGYLNSFRGFAGLHFANITVGDRNNNMTFGLGYAYLKTGGRGYTYETGTYYDENPYVSPNSGPGLKPIYKGPVFSVAGIFKVGAKASIVVDGIVGVFSNERPYVTTTEITPPSYNPTYTPGWYRHDVEQKNISSLAIILMPGMRFQRSERKAFQVSIAGVVWQNLNAPVNSYGYSTANNHSFPFPMCTWFYKF